mgnify:CR=1 FL=1
MALDRRHFVAGAIAAPALLKAGAKHVTAMSLTQRATVKYVRATLATVKGTAVDRRLSAGRIVGGLRRVREQYEGVKVRRRIRQIARDEEARKAMEAEVEGLMEVLKAVKRELRG